MSNHSVNTGLSTGSFHSIQLLNSSGVFQDLLALIGASGGGGLTSAQVTALINAALASYTNTTSLNTLLANYTNTTGLNALLANYTNTAGLTTLLAGKQATLTTPGAGVFLNGTTPVSYTHLTLPTILRV